MIKYILLALIVFYCAFVLRKMIKSLKKGKCIGCTSEECSCKCKKAKGC